MCLRATFFFTFAAAVAVESSEAGRTYLATAIYNLDASSGLLSAASEL